MPPPSSPNIASRAEGGLDPGESAVHVAGVTHDYRFWWALFVFFAALGVLVVQRRYRWWRRAQQASAELTGESRIEQMRRVRLEGWRLAMMTASLLVMTGLVFGVFLGAPAPLVLALRLLAILSVLGVVLLGLRL